MRRQIDTTPDAAGDPASDPASSSAYRIQAMVDGLDELAHAMEQTWGVDRLRLAVSDFLRAKFDEQKDRLDAALARDDERLVALQVDGMKRAWATLDRSAREAGALPLSPEVWECVLPETGEIVSLVRTRADAHHVARDCRVFTLTEVALLIEALGHSVLQVKDRFPGASIIELRAKPPIDWTEGDPMPF